MQIIWQVSSQSPVVWYLNEVYYWVIWMCAEAISVLRAVAADFFYNCWCLEIPSDNRIECLTDP
jgi:hypothetical protein